MIESALAIGTIAVSDIDQAKKFYGEILGFKAIPYPAAGVMYQAAEGTGFYVYQSQVAGTNQATYLTFEVKDLDATVKDLRDRGIVFEDYDFPGLKTVDGIAEMEDERAAWFKDPDGNILSVGQRPPDRSS